MPAHSGDIVQITATTDQVGLIGIKRLAHGSRSAYVIVLIGILAAARQFARSFLRLPEGQDLLAICFFMIVSKPELLDPIATLAVSRNNTPTAACFVAPVPQAHTRRNSHRVRLLSSLEPEARGSCFELSGSDVARH